MVLIINGKIIGEPIILTINIKNKKIEEFRKEFNLDDKEYNDNQLLAILQNNNYKFDKAFEAMFSN